MPPRWIPRDYKGHVTLTRLSRRDFILNEQLDALGQGFSHTLQTHRPDVLDDAHSQSQHTGRYQSLPCLR
jgi:hypothetical protein